MNVVSEATTLTTVAVIVVGVGGPAQGPVLGAMTDTGNAVTVEAEAGAAAEIAAGVSPVPHAGCQDPSPVIVDLRLLLETETIRFLTLGVVAASE